MGGGGAQILLERSRASVRPLSLEGAHLGPEGLRCSGGWGETRRWGKRWHFRRISVPAELMRKTEQLAKRRCWV